MSRAMLFAALLILMVLILTLFVIVVRNLPSLLR